MHQNNTEFVSQLLFREEQVTINIVWTVSVMLDLKWGFQPKINTLFFFPLSLFNH